MILPQKLRTFIAKYNELMLSDETGLSRLGFAVTCFPCKIKDASAGWIRAAALFFD